MLSLKSFEEKVSSFDGFGEKTRTFEYTKAKRKIPMYINKFWTSKQRQAHSLHEFPYRSCFKPQLPRFFIEGLTTTEDVIYDPFMGRGTTVIESALMKREVIGNDINPLSSIIVEPRLNPPDINEVEERLNSLDLDKRVNFRPDLLPFYHPVTLTRLTNLRQHFIDRDAAGTLDKVDKWIRMVATSRLTGHSSGFFSIYSMPPNQNVTIRSQLNINRRKGWQTPPERDVKALIMRKSKSFLRNYDEVISSKYKLFSDSAEFTPNIDCGSVNFIMTSPPFVNIVDYKAENWLRLWFNGIDDNIEIENLNTIHKWVKRMKGSFFELYRVLNNDGLIAFEVGDLSSNINMEDVAIAVAEQCHFKAEMVIINDDKFTKTSNIWGVINNKKGTNTNRVVIFSRRQAAKWD